MYTIPKKLTTLLYTLLLLLLIPLFTTAQETSFADRIIRIDSLDTITAINGLQPVTQLLQYKQLIGVGEATHGSREFMLAKSKLFLLLHRQLAVNDLVLEIPFSIGSCLTDYIYGHLSRQYIDSLLRPAKAFYCPEFFMLLDTLKALNKGKEITNGIRIWGLDLDQYYEYAIIQLKKAAIAQGESELQTLMSITAVIPQDYKKVKNFSKEYTTPEIYAAIEKIDTFFRARLSRFSTMQAMIITRCIRQLYNSFAYFKNNNGMGFRDRLMAENVQAITPLCTNGKAMVWAHNLHIRKHALGYKTMGVLLQEAYGDNYFTIGSIFSEGSYRVWYKGVLSQMQLPAGTSGSLAEFLSTVPAPQYLVATGLLKPYYTRDKVDVHDVGIMQAIDNPKANKATLYTFKDFDALMYFSKVSAMELY